MVLLDFRTHSNLKELRQKIVQFLLADGAILLRHLPSRRNNGPLLELLTGIRREDLSNVHEPVANLEDGFIHRVENLRSPLLNKHGWVITSTTSESFRCHTDQYLCENPADVVLFHCFAQARQGGETKLAYLHEVLKAIDPLIILELSHSTYPACFGLTNILSRNHDQWTVRYNPVAIERACLLMERHLTVAQKTALLELDKGVSHSEFRLKLRKNDCLILNNKKVLHGRSSFPLRSCRLLKRVRFHLVAQPYDNEVGDNNALGRLEKFPPVKGTPYLIAPQYS